MKLTLIAATCLITAAAWGAPVVLGPETALDADPRQEYPRFVNVRPADGQVVDLNPPRMSWPWFPDVLPDGNRAGDRLFTLQIASTPDFADPEVAEQVGVNFYNFLPPLEGAQRWYWRVAYDPGTEDERWSEVRSFTIAPDATVWDRSALQDLAPLLRDHPRMLIGGMTLDQLRGLRETDERSAELAEHIIDWADSTIEQDWYIDFPEDDGADVSYMQHCRSMIAVAFAYLLTGDAKYEGFRDRFLTVASWPVGGYSAPEGAGVVRAKWSTHLTGFLGLFYDWFHDELTEAERAVVRDSLQWRIEHTVWSFAFTRNEGATMHAGSIAMRCGSHPYENIWVSLPGMLAIADESALAREALEITLNYLIGVTNGFGPDEAWNEGPGYGNGKMKWLTDAAWIAQTAIPELNLQHNSAFDEYCDFFARVTPLGARHSSFGNRGINERDWASSRITNFRRVAMLRDNPAAMQNWLDTGRRLVDMTGREAYSYAPWIDYCLPAYADAPEPRHEDDPVRLFGLEGWVTVSSAPPSDYDAQQDAVGMVFHCRPRGGYGHSFRSENAFDIHAYGETITSGGGTTSNQEFFANHTMSHNTLLVGGREQEASAGWETPTVGRITRFARGDGWVYWAGDATNAYADEQGLERFVRHVLFVDDAYFVIFDDVAVRDEAESTTFQWLYHVLRADDMELAEQPAGADYRVGEVRVRLRHIPLVDGLRVTNYPGVEGMVNPITGEDVTRSDKWVEGTDRRGPEPADADHLWFTHGEPVREARFLAVVAPYRADDAPPEIEAAGEVGVRVSFRGQERTFAFGDADDADFVVRP